MSVEWAEQDEPFFREYNDKRPGEKRSLARARRVQELWQLDRLSTPIITVVGSKGKGTAAIFAAAALTGSGLRVGLVTSPSLRTNRERVRVDGQAMTDAEYTRVAARLADALQRIGPRTDGYLSPTGAYTLAAVDELVRRECDVIVLEEGLGGRSDEVSLFDPEVVAVTPIFEEHADLLGGGAREIADDLLGVVSQSTKRVVSSPQDAPVDDVVESAARIAAADLTWVTSGHDDLLEPARGLSRANARVGIAAAREFLELRGRSLGDGAAAVIGSITLPGRLTHVDDGGRHWVVDAAIEARGARSALEWCVENIGEPAVVLLGMPDIKPVGPTLAVFDGRYVLGARAGETHLTYDSPAWDSVPLLPWRDAIGEALRRDASVVLAVGTISFVAEMLAYLDVDCERVYERP